MFGKLAGRLALRRNLSSNEERAELYESLDELIREIRTDVDISLGKFFDQVKADVSAGKPMESVVPAPPSLGKGNSRDNMAGMATYYEGPGDDDDLSDPLSPMPTTHKRGNGPNGENNRRFLVAAGVMALLHREG